MRGHGCQLSACIRPDLYAGPSPHSDVPAPVLAQTRALQTYSKRVYYPFMLRDPEIHALDGMLCALWVHTHPTLAGVPHAHTSLSVAVVVPALSSLPAALATVEDVVAGSGALLHVLSSLDHGCLTPQRSKSAQE